MTLVILVFGLIAGALTTLAGAGGGVFLILALSLVIGPHAALAASAPTLLFGNMHRLLLYRSHVDRRIALRVIAGALPASLITGAITVSIPSALLRVVLFAVVVYAVARALDHLEWSPPPALLTPAGAVVGGVSATSGGAGLLLGPLLLSEGLTGTSYVATSAAIAFATHVGRLLGYGSRGLFSHEVLRVAAVATIAIIAGTLAGDRLRPLLNARRTALLEYGTLAACSMLAVLGIAH